MEYSRIAYRNVARQKRRSNLLAAAIGFGVMIILLVNSLTAGLIRNTQNSFTSALGGHIYVTGEVRLESGRVINRIESPEILTRILPELSPYMKAYHARSGAMGRFIFSSRSAQGTLYGVDWNRETDLIETFGLDDETLARLREPGMALIPRSLMEDLGAAENERILFSFETVTGQANVGEFTIAAAVADGSQFGLSAAYVSIDHLNPLLGLKAGEYQSLNIVLKDLGMIDEAAIVLSAAIRETAQLKENSSKEEESAEAGRTSMFRRFLPQPVKTDDLWEGTRFSVATLNDYMDMVTQVVNVLNGAAAGLFAILLLITMVGLINTFRMIMIERTREIGTLRAIGVKKREVRRLFLLEGLFLSLRGAALGLLSAGIIGIILKLISFPDDIRFAMILSNGRLSIPVLPLNILGVTAVIALITLAAVWFPAYTGSRLKPAEALRSRK